MALYIGLVVCILAAYLLHIVFSAPSWCQDCSTASHEEWRAGAQGYNSGSYSSFCTRHGKMWFRGLDRRP